MASQFAKTSSYAGLGRAGGITPRAVGICGSPTVRVRGALKAHASAVDMRGAHSAGSAGRLQAAVPQFAASLPAASFQQQPWVGVGVAGVGIIFACHYFTKLKRKELEELRAMHDELLEQEAHAHFNQYVREFATLSADLVMVEDKGEAAEMSTWVAVGGATLQLVALLLCGVCASRGELTFAAICNFGAVWALLGQAWKDSRIEQRQLSGIRAQVQALHRAMNA